MWFEVLAGEQSPHSWRVSSPLGGPGEVPTNPDCSEREWPGCVPWFRDSYRLGLPLWGAHHEAVELFAHFDLTRQPRVRLNAVSEIEHIRFHRRGFPNLFLPSGIDIDVARPTRAKPPRGAPPGLLTAPAATRQPQPFTRRDKSLRDRRARRSR